MKTKPTAVFCLVILFVAGFSLTSLGSGFTLTTTIIKSGVNLREMPGSTEAILFRADKGASVEISGQILRDGYLWYQGTVDGRKGYIRSDMVGISSEEAKLIPTISPDEIPGLPPPAPTNTPAPTASPCPVPAEIAAISGGAYTSQSGIYYVYDDMDEMGWVYAENPKEFSLLRGGNCSLDVEITGINSASQFQMLRLQLLAYSYEGIAPESVQIKVNDNRYYLYDVLFTEGMDGGLVYELVTIPLGAQGIEMVQDILSAKQAKIRLYGKDENLDISVDDAILSGNYMREIFDMYVTAGGLEQDFSAIEDGIKTTR